MYNDILEKMIATDMENEVRKKLNNNLTIATRNPYDQTFIIDRPKSYGILFDSSKYWSSCNDIIDVNVIVPNKVVEVTFRNGTKQKSVCREPDVFSLEQAVTICLCKQFMGGSGRFNRAVKQGLKLYEYKLKKAGEEKIEQERIAKKRAKRQAYMARKKAKKEQAERERAIEIQKEAYVRAMTEMREITNKTDIAVDETIEVKKS